MELAEETLRLVFACANLYLYHPYLLFTSVMFISLSVCISVYPSVYHLSTVLSHDHLFPFCFDADHREKASLCS